MIRSLLRVFGILVMLLAAWAVWAQKPAADEGDAAPANPVNPRYEIRLDRSNAHLNWLTGQMEAVGKGIALQRTELAKRQARATALFVMMRQARLALPTISVDGDTTLKELLKSDASQVTADGILANMTVVDEIWEPTTQVYTVVGVLPFYGENGVTVVGIKAIQPVKTLDLTAEQLTLLDPIPRGQTPQRFQPPYTGVIIDAKTSLVIPCLFPRLLRFDGKELWGPSVLTPAATVNGPVRYALSVNDAITHKVAGDHPLIISAIGNGQGGHVVLNVDDVVAVLTQQKLDKLLEKLPIIITLGDE